MTNSEKIKTLGLFINPDRHSIKYIAILDGCAYVTDGRIAIKMKLDEQHPNEVPESYPIANMESIIDDAEKCNSSGVISDSDFKKIDDDFMQYARSERSQYSRNYLERYTEMACPCCGDTVYFDCETNKLVEEMEPQDRFDIRDVSSSITLDFDERKIYVGMSYLHMIFEAFGKNTVSDSA